MKNFAEFLLWIFYGLTKFSDFLKFLFILFNIGQIFLIVSTGIKIISSLN